MSATLDDLLSTPTSSLLDNAIGSEPELTTLGDLRSSKATVYDFWTTRCANCPAALDSLDAIARQRPSVTFVGVNIDDAAAAKALVSKAALQGRWTSLIHAHINEDDKEKAKDILGMRTVPFYVVVGQDGRVLRHGNAKALPLRSAESLDAVLLQTAAADKPNENDPAVANTSALPAAAAAAITARGVDCEGGVCKLVRKKKVSTPEQAPTGTSAVRKGAVGEAAAAAASGPAPPAAPTRGMDCEGGVCKLVRKKAPAPEQPPSTGTPEAEPTVATAADPTPSPAPARAMDCEGGVCKLVRKKTPAAAAATAPESAGMGEAESPLVVGSFLPSLRVVRLDDGGVTTLEEVRAGGPAVLDFWTTRCVRCPAALDALEELAIAATSDAAAEGSRVTYISINLDSFEGAREVVGRGRWSSISHVFAGRDEDSEALESFKARAGLKSVPFYVVVAGGGETGGEEGKGRIEQIGGPKAVKLEKMGSPVPVENNTSSAAPTAAAVAAAAAATSTPQAVPAQQAQTPKVSSFTMDEDF